MPHCDAHPPAREEQNGKTVPAPVLSLFPPSCDSRNPGRSWRGPGSLPQPATHRVRAVGGSEPLSRPAPGLLGVQAQGRVPPGEAQTRGSAACQPGSAHAWEVPGTAGRSCPLPPAGLPGRSVWSRILPVPVWGPAEPFTDSGLLARLVSDFHVLGVLMPGALQCQLVLDARPCLSPDV